MCLWYILLDGPIFSQSLLSGYLTIVVRSEIVVHVSGLALLVANNILATRWWNSTACWALLFLHYLLTLKIIDDAELDLVPPPVGYAFTKGINYFINIFQNIYFHLTNCGIVQFHTWVFVDVYTVHLNHIRSIFKNTLILITY